MEKQFKNRIKHPVTILLCLPGFFILSCILGIVAWWFLGDILNLGEANPVSIWGGVGSAILCLILLLLHIPSYPDYVVTDTEIRILKRGRPIKIFPFAQYQITPYVEAFRYGLLPIGSSRALIVHEAGGKQKRIGINLSKRDFNEFIALLDKATSEA